MQPPGRTASQVQVQVQVQKARRWLPAPRMGAAEAVMGVGLLVAFYFLVASFGLGPADALTELPALLTFSDSPSLFELLSSPSGFRWVYGTTPGSTLGFVLVSLVVFLGGCLGLQQWMSSRSAYETGPELRGFTLVVAPASTLLPPSFVFSSITQRNATLV